ncbi:transposase [Streptomyces sp. NPDC001549]|uniref:transposase n=1 Tax=Streptomyces sp. NPDC001549 TaxID=3364586 RepID=UPI00367B53BC
MTGRLTRHPTALSEEDRAGLKDVLARCPELDTAAGHVRDFGDMLTDRLGARLPAWIDAVDASQLPGLTGFAPHLLRDLDAVSAGLTLHHWSSGSIEGAVNRIKKIKRQLYGRASWLPPAAEDDPAAVAPQYKDGAEAQPSRCPFALKMVIGSLLTWADVAH